jgi:MscS family membrane protein
MAKVVIVMVGLLFWLDNIGVNISALLTGLGVGGIAIALAVQDSFKSAIAGISIVLDKAFLVGQRIVVGGYDGVVEEIGLRSTKMRLLTGNQVTVPNVQLANAEIENIGRRPHIRRVSNITITYDTPLEKVERAVSLIKEILVDHEGMDPEFPPRVYFNEFNKDSLNIMIFYWYHPPDYWEFQALNQEINMQIMKAFEREGIEFAFPTTTTYLAHDDRRPLKISGISEGGDETNRHAQSRESEIDS